MMKLGSLNYSATTGEGTVKFAKTVDLTNPDIVLLDSLQDWICILTDTYNSLLAPTSPEEN